MCASKVDYRKSNNLYLQLFYFYYFLFVFSHILQLHFQYSTHLRDTTNQHHIHRMSFVAFHFHNTDYAFVCLFTSLTLHFTYFVVIQTSVPRSIYRLHYKWNVNFISLIRKHSGHNNE